MADTNPVPDVTADTDPKTAPKSIYETGAQYRKRIGKETEEDKAAAAGSAPESAAAEAPAANPAEAKKPAPPAAPAKGR